MYGPLWIVLASAVIPPGASHLDGVHCKRLGGASLTFGTSGNFASASGITFFWAAAKLGCNKWVLKGCLAALPGNRPKSALFALFLPSFRPFPEGAKSTWEKSRKWRRKAFFLRYPQICLNPPSLKPPFVALQFLLLLGIKQSTVTEFVCGLMIMCRGLAESCTFETRMRLMLLLRNMTKAMGLGHVV